MIGNVWVAERLRELLEQDGYNVVVTSEVQQALEILETKTPELILAEAEGGDIPTISARRECTRSQHIPVILLTQSALPSNYATSHQLGKSLSRRGS